jgi:putative membrane protein
MFGHDGWMGGTGMGIGMRIFWILLIIGVVALLRALTGRNADTPVERRESPLDILKARYARGEIGEDEFRRRRDELEK